jgi:hypothetical protein
MGFFVDVPEGFAISGGDGETSFTFSDPYGYMDFLIATYPAARYSSPEAIAKDIASKLKASLKTLNYSYEGRKACYFSLTFTYEKSPMAGIGIAIEGIGENSAKDTLLLSYAPTEAFEPYAPFMRSCLDGFSADAGAKRSPGPLSQMLRGASKGAEWAIESASGAKGAAFLATPIAETPRNVPFEGAILSIPYSARDAATLKLICRREYEVLSAYADDAELAAFAMTRFYHMVYRDAYRKLDRVALELGRRMGLPGSGERSIAERALAWVQSFHYERGSEGIDFVDPYSAAFEANGDCDSRVILMLIVLHHLNIDGIMMLSGVHSHAIAAVAVDGKGARFSHNEIGYLVAETTDEVQLGLIAAEMSDREDWIGIDFWF